MNNREVMQKALEALELAKLNGKAGMYPAEIEEIAAAITTLRAAPAEQCHCGDRPAAECPGEWEPGCDLGANEAHVKVHEPQEPVAWRIVDGEGDYAYRSEPPDNFCLLHAKRYGRQYEALYTHPAPQRQPQKPVVNQQMTTEPVAKVEVMTTGGNAGLATRIVEIDDHLRERLRPGQMLYTHPAPQRQPQDDPVAWMHPDDGRVIPAATMKIAVQDGGASLSSVRGYTIPLGPLRQPQEPQDEPAGTKSTTHEAIAQALSEGAPLSCDQRAVLLGLVADDKVWQRECDRLQRELAATHPAPQRQPLPKHDQHCVDVPGYGLMATKLVRAVERAHGIGG